MFFSRLRNGGNSALVAVNDIRRVHGINVEFIGRPSLTSIVVIGNKNKVASV